MITASQVVDLALSQEGDRYIFGVEVTAAQDNPAAFDCSELVQWIGARLGITPTVPDGSWIQWQHCKKAALTIPVAQAVDTKGALLFSFTGDPAGKVRPTSAHVAISQGNGRTLEARSTKYGVNQLTAIARGWTHAGLIPGVTYTKEAPIVPTDPTVPSDWAKPSWEKALAKEIVRGTHPRAAVTAEQIITYLDRAGALGG